jgi:hypothetical protein
MMVDPWLLEVVLYQGTFYKGTLCDWIQPAPSHSTQFNQIAGFEATNLQGRHVNCCIKRTVSRAHIGGWGTACPIQDSAVNVLTLPTSILLYLRIQSLCPSPHLQCDFSAVCFVPLPILTFHEEGVGTQSAQTESCSDAGCSGR